MLKSIREDVKPPANNASAVIGDFINRHIQNILVVNDEADSRTKMQAAPIQEPRGDLIIRFEPDTKKMFIVAKNFRTDCVAGQVHYKDTLSQLKAKGIFIGAENKRMTKGMKMASAGVHSLVFDCRSPDFIDMDTFVEAAKDHADRAEQL
jgi:hypothetical protein